MLLLYPKLAILQEHSLRTILLYLIRVLLLYLKLATLEPELRECSSCTTVAYRNCDFAAGALGMLSAYYFWT